MWARIAALCFLLLASPAASAIPYQLVWSDEFDGTALDPANWELQLGDGCPALCGWGNAELQYYQASNATVAGGLLTIEAREESVAGYDYTSARMRTLALADFTLGRFEMRARMPVGRGLWPAFWALFSSGTYGVWPASGEIDVAEYRGQTPDEVLGAIHYGSVGAPSSSSNTFTLASGGFDQDFHVFAAEWDRCEIRWSVDGVPYASEEDWFSGGGPYPAPFDHDFHILMNMAVGGNFVGPPDATTVFPQQFEIDYVRVYQKPDFPACRVRFDDLEHQAPLSNGWFSFPGSVGGGGISANSDSPAPTGEIGCRASLETGWGSGGTPGFFGGFGRTNPSDLSDMTHFTFWIDTDAGQDYLLEINLQDDDDGDDQIPATPDGADDEFQYVLSISLGGDVTPGSGWQRVSIPLADFVDDPSFHYGGNGVFDPVPVSAGGNGQLVNVVFVVISNSGADATFRTDEWRFEREDSSLSGRVFRDENADGSYDTGEPGIAGVDVELRDSMGAVVATSATLADGTYLFGSLPFDVVTLEIDTATVPDALMPSGDPDGVKTPNLATLVLGCPETNLAADFGYAPTSVPALAAPLRWLAGLLVLLLARRRLGQSRG